MQMKFLPDEPIDDESADVLELWKFRDVIQGCIYATEAPFVFGVLGDWGTGKTSLLRILRTGLERDLENSKQYYIPIWFNAWEYENEINLAYPLIHTIKRDYESRIPSTEVHQSFLQAFGRFLATTGLVLTDVALRTTTKKLIDEAISLGDVGELYEKVEQRTLNLEKLLGKWVDEVSEIRGAFQSLLDAYAKDFASGKVDFNDVKFVILIDDLDRCLPETALNLLEKIKNHLLVPRCIYVLALNPHVIYQGIRVKYNGFDINGREYLEKILNYSFYIPEPSAKSIATFSSQRLRLLVEDSEQFKYENFCRQFGEVLSDCTFTNPRKIKRVLNRYLLFVALFRSELERGLYNNENIVRLLIIAEYFPDVFRVLLSRPVEVKDELRQIGEPSFDIKSFYSKYGFDLDTIVPQLTRMKPLFELQETPDAQHQFDLYSHAYAIYTITRA